jgi:Secretion system C-terminal sorting domain
MVNNYYKAGPATPGSLTASSTSNKRNRIFNYTSFYYNGVDTVFGGKFYVNGNYVNGFADVTADNWAKGIQKDGYVNAANLLTAAKQTNPFPTSPVQTQTAEAAFLSVLDSAGAILPCRDTVDRRIVRETRTGTATFEGATYGLITTAGISHPSGIIDGTANVGGVPIYNSKPALLDTDADGMPDSWEILRGLNPNNAADRNGLINGYTNLEIYLNSITSPCAARVPTQEIAKGKTTFALANNPVGNTLIVNHLNLNETAILSVYDLKGVKLIGQKAMNADKTSLDIEALPSGFYILECQTATDKTALKFVKQ